MEISYNRMVLEMTIRQGHWTKEGWVLPEDRMVRWLELLKIKTFFSPKFYRGKNPLPKIETRVLLASSSHVVGILTSLQVINDPRDLFDR